MNVERELEHTTQNDERLKSPDNIASFEDSNMSQAIWKIHDDQMEGFWFTKAGFLIGNDDVIQHYKA